MCDGWFSDEHEYDGELVEVKDFKFCPDCLAEYQEDKHNQDEYDVMVLDEPLPLRN